MISIKEKFSSFKFHNGEKGGGGTTRGDRSDSFIIWPAAKSDSKEWLKFQASNLDVPRCSSRSIVLATFRAVSNGIDT